MSLTLATALSIFRQWWPILCACIGALGAIMHMEIQNAVAPMESQLSRIEGGIRRDESSIDDITRRLTVLEEKAIIPLYVSKPKPVTSEDEQHERH